MDGLIANTLRAKLPYFTGHYQPFQLNNLASGRGIQYSMEDISSLTNYQYWTEWRYELAEYGIDCDSFMPPNGFNCRLNNVNINQLSELSVLGVAKLDAVDKIRHGLAESLLLNNQLIIDVVLSGYNLPDGIHNRDDISILSYSSRFATVETGITGVNWLSNQDEVEWLEEKPVAYIQNSVANTIINSDDIRDHTKMSALDTSWSGLDGSGITVTVGDTGLDSGVNDATMHPDFSDHILGIYSWPRPYSECVEFTF